jgi:signal transduction histidine kinase
MIWDWSQRCSGRQKSSPADAIPVSLSIEGKLDNLPEALRLRLYRSIPEAMTNCGRHADASRVSVIVKQDETRVIAPVQDDGRGFDALLKTHSLGLLGMCRHRPVAEQLQAYSILC